MRVSAIIVTYNRERMLKKCIHSLLLQSYPLNNIVIVNNKSTDGTASYLRSIKNNKILIKDMKRNVGGSGGFSAGIRFAYEETTSDYFWIMDDDSMPKSDCLEKLVDGAKSLNYKFGFLCSNVRWCKDDSPCNLPTVDKDNWDEKLPGNLIKINIATFVSFLFSRDVVSKLGLPIRQMFIWGDDVDYSLRINNYRPCYFVANSLVIHNTAASPKASLFNTTRNKFLMNSFRNELYAYRKNGSAAEFVKKIIIDIAFIIRIPVRSKYNKLKKMYYSILGFIRGFFFNPRIEFPKKNHKY